MEEDLKKEGTGEGISGQQLDKTQVTAVDMSEPEYSPSKIFAEEEDGDEQEDYEHIMEQEA
jgi:hypothetical protein